MRDAVTALQAENRRLIEAIAASERALQAALARCHRAERDARTDALTGLPNRRALLEACERELAGAERHGRPFSVVMLDVDHFKRLNDTLGHAAGDAVLQAVASGLAGQVRKPDLPARYGGEEFMVLCPDTPAAGAAVLAERLRGHVKGLGPLAGPAGPLTVSVSCGVAGWQPGDTDVAAVIDRADEALYQAKRAGRDQVRVAAGPPIPLGV